MATLSKKFLFGLGIDEEKADLICERHKEVLSEVMDERDKYKEDADKYNATKAELDTLKQQTAGTDSYKDKYEALQKEYNDFKADVESKQTTAKKESAFRSVLKDIGIPDKRIDSVVKVSDINGIELDGEGIKDVETLKESLKKEWSDFITTTKVEGINSANPPSNTGKTTMTKEQIRAISDPIARQKAMLENPTLFGLSDNSNS